MTALCNGFALDMNLHAGKLFLNVVKSGPKREPEPVQGYNTCAEIEDKHPLYADHQLLE